MFYRWISNKKRWLCSRQIKKVRCNYDVSEKSNTIFTGKSKQYILIFHCTLYIATCIFESSKINRDNIENNILFFLRDAVEIRAVVGVLR